LAEKKPLPPWIELKKLTPKEALAYFVNKQNVPSFRWTDVWAREHQAAFTVAGMLRADLLKAVHDALNEAIKEGKTAEWLEKELTPLLVKEGWWGTKEITNEVTGETRTAKLGSPTRLRLIYDVNMRSAYAVGRWEQSERTKETAPLMMRRTMRDERVRETHKVYDGLVLPRDHPFWDEHAAPMGYRCRCIDIPVSEDAVQDYKDAGIKIKRTAPKTQYREFEKDGERIKVPIGVDPGFGYHPLKGRQQALDDAKKRSQASLPDAIRKEDERNDPAEDEEP
jgi:SPP1 gp7 family putative phage head morphogenesis protein